MSRSAPPDTIVVLADSVDRDDPEVIVGSNVFFVNLLFEEYLRPDEIPSDALRSYYADYYLAQVNNGGFSQFVYNSRWVPLCVRLVREGLAAIGAVRHLEVFDRGANSVDSFDSARLESYFASGYFGENPDRDDLNALNDAFMAVEKEEDLLALNAAWLRGHPGLVRMETEAQMRAEARRRGEVLPDREQRVAEALQNEPRYMKLIRALCDRAGRTLERVTAGDPTHEYAGQRVLAWHFITDQGHHHMLDVDARAMMFSGHSDENMVCEIDASEDP